MFKFTCLLLVIALVVMSEAYHKSNRGHEGENEGNRHGNSDSGSRYPRPQEGLENVHGGGGSQYPRQQEGLGGSGYQQQGRAQHSNQGGNTYGRIDQGGYKRHGY